MSWRYEEYEHVDPEDRWLEAVILDDTTPNTPIAWVHGVLSYDLMRERGHKLAAADETRLAIVMIGGKPLDEIGRAKADRVDAAYRAAVAAIAKAKGEAKS